MTLSTCFRFPFLRSFRFVYRWSVFCAFFVFCAANVTAVRAQTFTILFKFHGTDGANPISPLVQGFDGNLYGTADGGGGGGTGTVFKFSSKDRSLTTLYNFCSQSKCADGTFPVGLAQANDGTFFGTTFAGGANIGKVASCQVNEACGTVFKITSGGALTTLYSFCNQPFCADGAAPNKLAQATDGNFYGTTRFGGIEANQGVGTVFKITPDGTLTTLHVFCVQNHCPDGSVPAAGLIQGGDGSLYGTTDAGGSIFQNCGAGCGTVFKITTSGVLTTLHSFCDNANCPDGANPQSALVETADGNLFGTAAGGGVNGGGTIYQTTPEGSLSVLDNVGGHPMAALVQGTDGNFYGTTSGGVGGLKGTVFRITPAGVLTTLHTFLRAQVPAGLVQATDGNFYGTAYGRNSQTNGFIFRLKMGLGPFVETVPTSAAVASSVTILGTNLTGATAVSFNGSAASSFTLVSATQITAIVPNGATTGTVTVTLPKGTLSSNVVFRVQP